MKSKSILLVLCGLVFVVGIGGVIYKNRSVPVDPIPQAAPDNLEHPKELPPIVSKITQPQPSYMTYDQTVAQLKKWNTESPDLTEVDVYGKTSKGKSCHYIRVFNKRTSFVSEKPKVLVTACIHGNEPLASSVTMWYVGALLDNYGKDDAITEIVNSRDIYFVPVVSPDSYPVSRLVDGVDPNRDFPSPERPSHKSVAPVKAIQDLFMKIKPNAVMSGHTWGRVYLTPYGDKLQNCPDHDAIMAVTNKMKALSGYRCIRTCDMYSPGGKLNNPPIRKVGEGDDVSLPIRGTEVDWYYRNGSFAIVTEYGTHQRIPTDEDTKVEFNRTFQAFLLFLREAPLVQVHPK
jgi:hypothetical protein